MSANLCPYLNFPGTTREAMEFYRSVLGGELGISTFGEFGMADTPQADKIMHSQLETPSGFLLMAADLMPGVEHTPGNDVTISISGTDDVLRDWFAGLAEGGTVGTPLEKQVWGDEYGDLVDRFGVRWMVNVTASQDSPGSAG